MKTVGMYAPKIALIHATSLAAGPVTEAFSRLWPAARRMNLLDDSLSPDLERAGGIDEGMHQRFASLVAYAKATGADGILFTCSAFGPAIDAARKEAGLPVLKPNEAMFSEALDQCARLQRPAQIGMLSTFAASVPTMREELTREAAARGLDVALTVVCPEGALDALARGDKALHDQKVMEGAKQLKTCAVLMLGQFSMAHLREPIERATGQVVLSSPDSAVVALRRALDPQQP